jgi:hypothetical protein
MLRSVPCHSGCTNYANPAEIKSLSLRSVTESEDLISDTWSCIQRVTSHNCGHVQLAANDTFKPHSFSPCIATHVDKFQENSRKRPGANDLVATAWIILFLFTLFLLPFRLQFLFLYLVVLRCQFSHPSSFSSFVVFSLVIFISTSFVFIFNRFVHFFCRYYWFIILRNSCKTLIYSCTLSSYLLPHPDLVISRFYAFFLEIKCIISFKLFLGTFFKHASLPTFLSHVCHSM